MEELQDHRFRSDFGIKNSYSSCNHVIDLETGYWRGDESFETRKYS